LEECAAKYRQFCRKYRPKPKPEKRNHWGSSFLPSLKNKGKKKSPGQMSLPWDNPFGEVKNQKSKVKKEVFL
jgi:putative transposase